MNSSIQNKKPCRECPFKRASIPGYLGEASYQPDSFINSMEYQLLPCHLAVDWEGKDDPDQIAKDKPCIGSLQFCKNSGKSPRGITGKDGKAYAKFLNQAEKNPDVFQWKHEFVEHHSKH